MDAKMSLTMSACPRGLTCRTEGYVFLPLIAPKKIGSSRKGVASFQKKLSSGVSGRRPQRVFFDSKAPASHSENPVEPSSSDKSMLLLVMGTHLPDEPEDLYRRLPSPFLRAPHDRGQRIKQGGRNILRLGGQGPNKRMKFRLLIGLEPLDKKRGVLNFLTKSKRMQFEFRFMEGGVPMTTALTKKTNRPSWLKPFWGDNFDLFFDRLWPDFPMDFGGDWSPKVDLFEKDGNYHLTAEVPGMSKDDISVSIHEGLVTVSGKKESSKEEKENDYYMKETQYGSFSRSFRLPGEVDEEKVDATYKDGVLTVVMPKKEDGKTKKIEVH
jgi:HSP20 family protein